MKKILIFAVNPTNTTELHLDEEVRSIENAYRQANKREKIDIISKWAVRVDDLRRELLYYNPNIVHFCGHGRGDDGLVLVNESGQIQLVDSKSLAGLFQLFKDHVDCVVMNACYSERQARAIYQHINCVIGMNKNITDKAAIKFAAGFYDALCNGRKYEDSFYFGRNAINLENIPEWQTPQIFIRDSSKSLLDLDSITPEILKNALGNKAHRDIAADISSKIKDIINKDEITIDNIYKAYEDYFAKLSQNSYISDWQEKKKESDDINDINKFVDEICEQLKEHSEENRKEFIDMLKNTSREQKQSSNNKSFETNNKTKSLQSLHSYLLIQLRPDANNKVFFKAWFILDDTIKNPQERFKSLTVDEQQTEISFVPEQLKAKLPKLLNDLIEQCFPIKGRELIIEIFLPWNLLWDEEVEKWKSLDDYGSYGIIGSNYRLVVRSYERIKNWRKQLGKQAHQNWENNWDIVKNNLEKCIINNKNLVMKFDERDFNQFDSSELADLLDNIICAQICCNLYDKQPETLLRAIHSAGTPIVILSRRFALKNEINEFQKLLEKPLHQLPALVKEQRSLALKQTLEVKRTLKAANGCNQLGHLGDHLVLLWDNPYRLPPNLKDYPLQPISIPA